MARAHLKHKVIDRAGNAVQTALVHVFLKGTATPVSDMFAAETGGSAITTLTSNNQGEVEAWLDTPKFVDLNVTDNTDTAFYPGVSGLLSFASFTETVEVKDPPGEGYLSGVAKASLPTAGIAGRLQRVTDNVRGVWMDQGSQWFSLSGEVVNVKEFGAKGDGVTDDTAAIQAALDALDATSGAVILPHDNYGITAPLIGAARQKLMGMSPGDAASGATITALAGFTGDAMFLSQSWSAGGWWHFGGLENLSFNCADRAAVGVGIHQLGEESVIRRVSVRNATEAGYKFTGVHAVGHLEDCSAWVDTTGAVGYKFTVHPGVRAADGNSGVVRMFGISGDNGVAGSPGTADSFIFVDGGHTLTIIGVKAELHTRILDIAGSGNPTIYMTGDAIRDTPASGDVVRISGTAAPNLVLEAMRALQYTNIINDTVLSRTIASPGQGTRITRVVWAPAMANPNFPFIQDFGPASIIQSHAIGVSALRVRRFSSGSTAATLVVENETGVSLAKVNADGSIDAQGATLTKGAGALRVGTVTPGSTVDVNLIRNDTVGVQLRVEQQGNPVSGAIANFLADGLTNSQQSIFVRNKSSTGVIGRFNDGTVNVLDIDTNGLTVDAGKSINGRVRRTLGLWTQDNVAASQAAVALNLYGDTTRSKRTAIRSGSITGIVVRSNEARTAGTLTVEVTKNGVATGLTAVLDGTNTTFKATTQATGLDTYVAGDEIGATITTDAGWTPTTADISVECETVE